MLSHENQANNNQGDTELFNIKTINRTDNTSSSPPFWSTNPNILFSQKYLFDFFPTKDMSPNQQLNTITRLVIVLAVIGFFITRNNRIIITAIVTIIAIYVYYKNTQPSKTGEEGFDYLEKYINPTSQIIENPAPSESVFQNPDSTNPFSNVLLTDYDFNPFKKPAPPSYNENINNNILLQAKKLVNEANPEQPNISDKLFKGLGDEMDFEQSLRQFNSNPNTTIPNDQQAFTEFCYGGIVSCKEGNLFACARNLSRYTNAEQ
jgi:hypothetical protein